MRNVNTDEENLLKAVESLNAVGFINYFGMQRFGTSSIPTYQVSESERESESGAVYLCYCFHYVFLSSQEVTENFV